MIEPLRYNAELSSTFEITRPVFCGICLSRKKSRANPSIATKYCAMCVVNTANGREHGTYLCKDCDELQHNTLVTKAHIRQIIVIGPGIRKKMLRRGDGKTFPLPLDTVKIRYRSTVYHMGKKLHTEPTRTVVFTAGLSGKTIHVQLLGARNLVVGDTLGTSDPYVVYSYCGKPLASTRVRPRTLNPRWNNETFIIPIDNHLPNPRNFNPSQKDLVKFEVFDHDWFSQNEFLGQVEISRSKLVNIAVIAEQQTIRLPLTLKEYHGSLSVKVGLDHDKDVFVVNVHSADNLDKFNALFLSNPFVKVYLGDKLVGTTSVVKYSISPQWQSGNSFKVQLGLLLARERDDLLKSRLAHVSNARGSKKDNNRRNAALAHEYDAFAEIPPLLRFEIYHHSSFRKPTMMGESSVTGERLRELLPTLPTFEVYAQQQQMRSTRSGINKGMSFAWSEQQRINNETNHYYSLCCACFKSKPNGDEVSVTGNDVQDESPPVVDSELGGISRRDTNGDDGSGIHMVREKIKRAVPPPPTKPAAPHNIKPVLGNSFGGTGSRQRINNSSDLESNLKSITELPFQAEVVRPSISRERLASPASSDYGRGSTPGVVSRMQSKFFNREEVIWSDCIPLPVLKDTGKNTAHHEQKDRGQLIVRLLPSARGNILTGLDEAVRYMSLGEAATVKCRYDYAYGNYSMGDSIPPRSNVVFKVEVLEINGQGKYDMPIRVARRVYRGSKRFILAMYNYFFPPEVVDAKGKKKRKKKITRLRRVSVFFGLGFLLGPVADSESESDSSGEDIGEENSDEEDSASQSNSALTYDSAKELRMRADPRMRKHLNKAVTTGATYMWGYKPSQRPRRETMSTKKSSKRHRNSSFSIEEDEKENENEEECESGRLIGNEPQSSQGSGSNGIQLDTSFQQDNDEDDYESDLSDEHYND